MTYLSSKQGWGFFCGNETGSHIAYNCGNGRNFWGESFNKGDIIGMMFEQNEKNNFFKLSFYKNGKSLGTAWDDIDFVGFPLHFVVHTYNVCSVELWHRFWSVENHSFFIQDIRDNIFLFLLILRFWRQKYSLFVPRVIVYFILSKIESVFI